MYARASIEIEDDEVITMVVLNVKQPMKNWIIVAAPWTFEELYARISRMKHGHDETVTAPIIDIHRNPRKTSKPYNVKPSTEQ